MSGVLRHKPQGGREICRPRPLPALSVLRRCGIAGRVTNRSRDQYAFFELNESFWKQN